ncbi:MAG: hypothetical protein ACM3SQ_15945 [Betaproteobacteria bacterium]
MRFSRALTGLAAALMCVQAALAVDAGMPTPASPSAVRVDGAAPALPLVSEYRYRIIGKIRLLFFWVSRDDVGGARMSSYANGDRSALALLVGSEPGRAPRGLNEWGYMREEVGPRDAATFMVRSLSEAPDSPPSAGGRAAPEPRFGAVCADVRESGVRSMMTKFNVGRDVTFRMFDRLLDGIETAPQWKPLRTSPPAGAAPGFLTAMQRLLHVSAADPHPPAAASRVAYFYNDAIYDLELRRTEALGSLVIDERRFERLLRSDLAIRSRQTNDVTKVAVTFDPAGAYAFVPVRIEFQPNWWLRVELRLDEAADVPSDPGADAASLARIRDICSGVARAER